MQKHKLKTDKEKLLKAKALAESCLKKHNIKDWQVVFSPSKLFLGACYFKGRMLCLRDDFILLNTMRNIKKIILHEIAHILAGIEAKHSGTKWSDACKRVGIRQDCQYDKDFMLPYKWQARCSKCDAKWKRYKKLNNMYCVKCNIPIKWERIKEKI